MPKSPADAGHIMTDEILNGAEAEITAAYEEANAEMTAKLLDFLFTIDDMNDARQIYQAFRLKHKMKLDELKSGKISVKEYREWKAKALMAEKSWLPLQQTLASDLTHTHEIATSIINDKKCDVYALNKNYATYEIEKGIGASTSFALYDHDTVERLLTKNSAILPSYKVNRAKDIAWNTKHIRQAVTQGILQGESNQAIAARMKKVCNMSANAAIRTARTATTCAQNSGRIDGYKRAMGMGIDVKQIWLSTLDGRTRHEHRQLMGQKREVGKPFEVNGYEIMFPGDPTAEAFLVYNCRCTLIADVGKDYDLESRISETLAKKDLTIDEWIKEQPLPRHYNESLKNYLKRYSEHHKKLKFSDWLEEQAMPDALITKNWADKKMSNIYNMIKDQNVTDANKFYKELGKLGKPSETWEKYLLGELDAIDLKQFEEILKKYLPKEKAESTAKKETIEQMHEKAIAAEKQIKYTKSDPMSFDDADMHHVNPGYKGNSGIYSKNCQTCAMTYEARRQGYDVEALGKDPTHPHTFALQKELGIDQANGWINKITGEKPVHLNIPKGKQKYKWLEDTVGHNGERYTLSVRWKSGGAHVINMDRDADGVLRLIDNQRGPHEKHIWKGEQEIKEYLNSVKDIKYVLRVDDCIPNPKYFNMITKETKTKIGAQSNWSITSKKDAPNWYSLTPEQQEQIIKHAEDIGEKPSQYYNKWKHSKKIDDPFMNEFFGISKKSASEPIKKTLDKSLFKNKKMSAVYTDIKKTDVKTANAFYKELQKMGKPSDVWDKYLKGELSEAEVEKIEKHLAKKYSDLEEALPGESVTGLDIDTLSKKKVTGVYNDFVADGDKTTANQFYNELKKIATKKGYKSQSDVWKKYLNGELDFDDIEKIDKYVIKKYQTKASTPGVEPAVKTKADLPDDPFHLDSPTFNTLDDYIIDHYNKISVAATDWIDYYKKYKKGDIIDPELDKVLGIKSIIKSDIDYDKLPLPSIIQGELEKEISSDIANEFINLITDMGLKYNKSYLYIWKKYKKKELTESEMKQIDDIVGKLDKYKIKDAVSKIDYDNLPPVTKVYSDLNDISSDLSFKFYNALNDAQAANESMLDVWEKYKKKQLTKEQTEEIDKLVEQWQKHASASTITMTDELKEVIIYFTDEVKDPILKDEIWNLVDNKLTIKYGLKTNDVWKKYWKGELNEPELDVLIKKAGVEPPKFTGSATKQPAPKPAPAVASASATSGQKVVDLDQLKNKKVTEIYNEIKSDITIPHSAGSFYNELKKIGKDTGIGKQGDVWAKYVAGKLDPAEAAKIDKYVIGKYSKIEEPIVPAVDIDAIKNKKMSQFYNELKSENVSNANKFYNELKKHGKPSEVWTEYIKGELPEDAAKKIDEYVIKKYSKGVKASEAQKQTLKDQIIKTADNVDIYDLKKLAADNKDLYDEAFNVLHGMKGSPGTNWKKYLIGKLDDPELDKILVKHNLASDDIVKKVEQQKELDAAKKELEKAKAALPNDKKYSGIWKDEVSLSDYAQKKNAIAAKKVYFEDELEKAKQLKNQNPHEPGTPQYDGYIKWNESQIEKFEKLLKSIDEFEQLGKEYEKAQKLVEKAQKKVNDLTPESEMYSQERKNNARWFTRSQYRSGDTYYTKWAKPIHATATSGEHSAYYAYTLASGAFNRPLAGFKSPKYSGGSGWDQKYFKGVGKVPLDNEGKGSQIRNLTSFIEKSKTVDDIWIQTAQNFATLEGKGGFLDIPYGALQRMTDAELQQFVGIESQLGQFVSGSINRGGGSYNPGSMRINIYCPKGSEALYVLGDGAFGKSEHEIILQRGGTYKITKMYWGRDAESGGRKLIVDMELRLEKGYNKYDQ